MPQSPKAPVLGKAWRMNRVDGGFQRLDVQASWKISHCTIISPTCLLLATPGTFRAPNSKKETREWALKFEVRNPRTSLLRRFQSETLSSGQDFLGSLFRKDLRSANQTKASMEKSLTFWKPLRPSNTRSSMYFFHLRLFSSAAFRMENAWAIFTLCSESTLEEEA